MRATIERRSSVKVKRQNHDPNTITHYNISRKENALSQLSDEQNKPSVFATAEVNLVNFSWYCRMSGFKFNSKCERFCS